MSSGRSIEAASITVAGHQPIPISTTDVEAMRRVMINEAGGEGVEGMRAVASVIMNRLVASHVNGAGKFGDTIEEIVNKPAQFSGATAAGGWSNLRPGNAEERKSADEALSKAMSEGDNTNGATFFLNRAKATNDFTGGADSNKTVTIGDHTFHRPGVDPRGKPVPSYQVAARMSP